jgi:hypothetical protein
MNQPVSRPVQAPAMLELDDLEFAVQPIAPSEGTTVWKTPQGLRIRTGIRAGLFDSQNNNRGGY